MKSSLANRNILITGGRGRLASVIRQVFAERGAKITSFSRTEGDPHLDIETLFVDNLIDSADTFLHLAWSTVPLSSERNIGLEWNQDIPLLIRILKTICQSPNHKNLHFIFFSSGGSVYGNAPSLRPCSEFDPCNPIGWYGHAKFVAERIISEFGRRYGIKYTILRVSNPYGFRVPLHKPQGIIPIFLKHVKEGLPLTVWGDGSARKDFIHYTDFNSALAEVIRRQPLGIFNVCSGISHTVNEVIALIEESLGRKAIVEYLPSHPWDVHDSVLDNTKLVSAIGWQPTTSLSEGIRRTASELFSY